MPPPVMSNPVMSNPVPTARAVVDEFAAAGSRGDATLLRCGGCGDTAVITQGERGYGPLVHGFLGGHELCRSAVEITRSIAVAC
jgi:hypothetical protein